MNLDLAREIVRCLRVPRTPPRDAARMRQFSLPQWNQTLGWLHASGIALYFWQRLKETRAESALPVEVCAGLERNLRDNRRRLSAMAEEFQGLNRRFEDAGIEYAVLKGLALVPEYCPDPTLRAQYDYDYLIRPESLDRADQALRTAGYIHKPPNGKDHPLVYVQSARPVRQHTSWDGIYSPEFHRSVELHVRLWEPDCEKIYLDFPEDPLSRVQSRAWHGLCFYTLSDNDTLVLETLHALRHILNYWCRISVLLEMANFLRHRSSDAKFWELFRKGIRGQPGLARAIGVVFLLAGGLFDAEIPATAGASTNEMLSPVMALWVERYGLNSALENFSGNKFSLYLHREFVQNAVDWRKILRTRLFPIQLPHRAAEVSSSPRSSILGADWRGWAHILSRLRFHLSSALRYAWELPRWNRSVRRKARDRRFRDPQEIRPWPCSPRTAKQNTD